MEVNLELSPVTRKCFLSLWGSEVFPQKQGSLFITRNMGLSCGLQPQQNSHGSQWELWLSQLLWKMFFFFSFFPLLFSFFPFYFTGFGIWSNSTYSAECNLIFVSWKHHHKQEMAYVSLRYSIQSMKSWISLCLSSKGNPLNSSFDCCPVENLFL